MECKNSLAVVAAAVPVTKQAATTAKQINGLAGLCKKFNGGQKCSNPTKIVCCHLFALPTEFFFPLFAF